MKRIWLRVLVVMVLVVGASGAFLVGQNPVGSALRTVLATPALRCDGTPASSVVAAQTAAAAVTQSPIVYATAVAGIQSAWNAAATVVAASAKDSARAAQAAATSAARDTATAYSAVATPAAGRTAAAIVALPTSQRAAAKTAVAKAYATIAAGAGAQSTVQANAAKAVGTAVALETTTAVANAKAINAWNVAAAKTAVKVSVASSATAQAISTLAGNAQKQQTAVARVSATVVARAAAPTPATIKVAPITQYTRTSSDCWVTVTAAASGIAPVVQWQVNEDGQSWLNIHNGFRTYAGAPTAKTYSVENDATSTLAFTGTATQMVGYQYRALLTTDGGGVVTNPVALHFPSTITGLSVSSGSASGGDAVVIHGTGFSNVLAVNFGGLSAATISMTGTTDLTVMTPSAIPPPAAGPVDVSVITKAGTATDVGAFTWTAPVVPPTATSTPGATPLGPPPSLSGISAPTGPDTGGTAVVISGMYLTGATAVHFGHASAAFHVDNDNQITVAASPPMSSQDSDGAALAVTVTTLNGTSSAAIFTFTYVVPLPTATTVPGEPTNTAIPVDTAIPTDTPYPPPVVTGLSITRGKAQGGDIVTVYGHNFGNLEHDGGEVNFGGVYAHFGGGGGSSDSQVTVYSPASTAGTTVDVTVWTQFHGTSAVSAADKFTYVPAPVVSAVSPGKGPSTGGTTVTITGTNFSGATEVDFGSIHCSNFTVNDDTSITAISPAGNPFPIDVQVLTPGGLSATSSNDIFRFDYSSGQ